MRKKMLRQELKRVFEAPMPERKEEFLRKTEAGTLEAEGAGKQLLRQAGYVQKSSWIFSAGAFCIAACAGIFLYQGGTEQGFLRCFLAMAPFLVLFACQEFIKADFYGMKELERTARFSPEKIVSARLVIFGIFDAILLLPAFCITAFLGTWGLCRTAFLLLLPYLCAAVLCLWILGRFSGAAAFLYCFSGCAFLSGFCLLAAVREWTERLPEALLGGLCLAAAAGLFIEIRKFKEREGDFYEAYC